MVTSPYMTDTKLSMRPSVRLLHYFLKRQK
jgi:hypothetical protein